jgi:hypothetical protein
LYVAAWPVASIGCNIGVSDPLERESEAYLIAQNVTFFAVLTATCAVL